MQTASSSVNATEPPEPAVLGVLVYLCGDNHIKESTDAYLKRMRSFGPSRQLHLAVQYDTAIGAKRYVVRADDSRTQNEEPVRRDVNTGDARALEEFLDWGLKEVVAQHYVLILSGLGINPRYVRQSLPLKALPEPLQEIRGGRPGDPNDPAYTERFADAIARLSQADRTTYRNAVHQQLFSICHDFSNSGSLAIHELRQVLTESVQKFSPIKRDPRFDLVLFDVGAAAFVEVLFELEGLAQVFVGSQDILPDEGLPYSKIFQTWNGLAGRTVEGQIDGKPLAQELALSFLNCVEAEPALGRRPSGFVAVNLEALDEVARVLDTLALALLHSLGDWHVLDAISQAGKKTMKRHRVSVSEPIVATSVPSPLNARSLRSSRSAAALTVTTPPATAVQNKSLDDIEFLPAVDLFALLDAIEVAFSNKLLSSAQQPTQAQQSPRKGPTPNGRAGESDPNTPVPMGHGQHERVRGLYKLIRKTIAHLHSEHLLGGSGDQQAFLYSSPGEKRVRQGVSILLPPARTPEEIKADAGRMFSLSSSSYARLNFSRRVHWSALIGAIQLIHEKPHALWRVISSMLADASSTARDAALGRLISSQSVISDMRQQFQSLGESESLTLSLDPQDSANSSSEVSRFQVRLTPSLGSGVIYQQDSRVYKSSLEATLRELHVLLHQSRSIEKLRDQLRSLGASLGEDIIQDLVKALDAERATITARHDQSPHLTLQMPRSLMKFPWELMHDRQGMLCERFALGRQVFMETQLVRPVVRRSSDVIRVLVIGDPAPTPEFSKSMTKRGWTPAPLPSARVEATAIADAFQQLNDEMGGVVEFKIDVRIGGRVSINDLRMALRDDLFDVIHYAGHAFFSATDSDGSAWVLSDGLLHAREIRNTLAWAKCPPWLIFANACEAGMDDDDQSATKHSDVTGLATACINQGVAAYIAPLWPVDDEIARWLAIGFYRELLRERFSVGEALRRARMAIWKDLQESGADQTMPAKTALTWSSFVLYGDPTARLLQTLWSPAGGSELPTDGIAPPEPTPSRPSIVSPRRFRQATADHLADTISLPDNLLATSIAAFTGTRGMRATERGALAATPGITIELVERSGLRFWRAVTGNPAADATRLSPLGRLLDEHNVSESADQTRQVLRSLVGHERGVMDFVNVVKTWFVKSWTGSTETSLVRELAAEFDREQVPEEGLFRYSSPTERRRILSSDNNAPRAGIDDRGEWLTRPRSGGQVDRALLIIHGTFSKCEPTLADFAKSLSGEAAGAENLFNWMLRRYRAVLGFDHWTLSKSPEENAKLLLEQLPKTWHQGHDAHAPLEIDIICHSRGGLVARALMELLKPKIKVGRVVFVGVPNAGTHLANPKNWAAMADVLVNLVSQDPTGLYGRLSGFLFYMLAQEIGDNIPGLQAMNPLTADKHPGQDNSFLERLQQAGPQGAAEYFVVASNYAPNRDTLNVISLLKEAGDQLLDKFFAEPNDLVVHTASMWAFDQPADWMSDVPDALRDRVLLFNTELASPGNVAAEVQTGVHHVNYFTNRRVREFLQATLPTPE